MTDLVELALALRDRGMSLAEDAQNAISPQWSDRAYEAIVRLAKAQATVHVDDILTTFAERPSHPNAWGPVWKKAIKAKVIEHSGQVRRCTVDVAKHAHNSPVYRSLAHRRTP